MTQNIREEFEKKFVVKSNAGTNLLRYTDADKILDFFLSHHNTTLKEIEEGAENVELNLEAGNKDHENFAKGVDYMREKVKQLIHQKLIK